MKPINLTVTNPFPTFHSLIPPRNNPFPRQSNTLVLSLNQSKPIKILPLFYSKESNPVSEVSKDSNLEGFGGTPNGGGVGEVENLGVQVGDPVVPSFAKSYAKLSLGDQAFFLFSFVACTTSVAFVSFVVAAVPTLFAMSRAATSVSKLADTLREELPSTMAAIRLSGMEISDLILELNDLSEEISDGVTKSAQAVQAAETGIRKIGALAHQHTISMIQERANLPVISLQPVVAGAAKKTSRAVGQATKTLINIISRGDFSSGNEDDSLIDRVES